MFAEEISNPPPPPPTPSKKIKVRPLKDSKYKTSEQSF